MYKGACSYLIKAYIYCPLINHSKTNRLINLYQLHFFQQKNFQITLLEHILRISTKIIKVTIVIKVFI